MAVPTNTSTCGNYVVVQDGNPSDITTITNKTQIGTVRQRGWMVDWCMVGDVIMYKTDGALQFIQNGVTYNVIIQQSVILITTGSLP